jgi:nicotinic acid mononucleotide adenylyltransferase
MEFSGFERPQCSIVGRQRAIADAETRRSTLSRVELLSAQDSSPEALALLPGSFNPPTRAHVEMARAALGFVDSVLFVLPRSFPHKPWTDASLNQRIEMLGRIAAADPRLGVALSDGGLYIEMAREAQTLFPAARVELLLGSDAAERIATWNYDVAGVFEDLMREFQLRVAPRGGVFEICERLELPPDCETISSTEVRRRIRQNEPWEHLVPAEISDIVRALYLS